MSDRADSNSVVEWRKMVRYAVEAGIDTGFAHRVRGVRVPLRHGKVSWHWFAEMTRPPRRVGTRAWAGKS